MPDVPSGSEGPPAVLLLHGLGGGPYELEPVAEALREAGCRVAAPTLPGHEESHGATMPGSDWRDWFGAAEAGLDALRAEAGGAPVAVVGFSTGGTLALRLASRRPEAVGRLALLAPFLAIRFSRWLVVPARSWLGPIAWALPSIPRRPAATRCRVARRELAGSSRFRTFSLVATQSALELIDRVGPDLDAVRCPTLILQGSRDSVVEPQRASWLLDRLGASEKGLEWFARSDHLLAWDHDRVAVASAVVGFVASGKSVARVTNPPDPRPLG